MLRETNKTEDANLRARVQNPCAKLGRLTVTKCDKRATIEKTGTRTRASGAATKYPQVSNDKHNTGK
jgi:hypothetical protein